jgi:hypothetical protein
VLWLELYLDDELVRDIDFALGYVPEMKNPSREKFVRLAAKYAIYLMRVAGDLPSREDSNLDWLD